MKIHEQNFIILLVIGLTTLAGGCAIDARTGRALADALASGPVRDYASAQADLVAETCMVLEQQVAPPGGGLPELVAARGSWHKARAAYDRGVTAFLVVAPELDFLIDGKMDDLFARSGLRPLELALFVAPPPADLVRLTQKLGDAAIALHTRVPDAAQPLLAAELLGSMAAVAGQLAAKFDGSASPYAGASLFSVQNNLTGLTAIYTILAPLVQGVDPVLDQRISGRLRELLAQISALQSLDDVTDKTQLFARVRRPGPGLFKNRYGAAARGDDHRCELSRAPRVLRRRQRRILAPRTLATLAAGDPAFGQ